MKFSEYYNADINSSDEWFDPILNLDTKLFIDPFLIFDQEFGNFIGSHEELISFFQKQFKKIALTSGNPKSARWKRVEQDLLFPEVEELCLGYTAAGTGGAGSGTEVAKALALAIWEAIDVGVQSVDHFEEVQFFQEGINRDRISDTAAKILFHRFADYTKKICDKKSIDTREYTFKRTRYDITKGRWISGSFQLPANPYNGKAVLLCPKRFLRTDPTLNPDSYFSYMRAEQPEILRSELGEEILSSLNKSEIIKIAKRYPDTLENYVKREELKGSSPYNYKLDPKGLLRWYDVARKWAVDNRPTIAFHDKKSFVSSIDKAIDQFQNYVENQGGWKLLWNDNGTAKAEEAAQRLFLGIILHACMANNIDVSQEANIGRGPVDFKTSSGYNNRALIELKLAKNSKFWRGLEKQLPKYLQAEGVEKGYFVVVCYRDEDLERIIEIEGRVRTVNQKTPYDISAIVVDASRDKPSASKL